MTTLDCMTIELPHLRRDHKPRGAFGLEYVSRTEYTTPCGLGHVEHNGRDWDAWRDDLDTLHTGLTLKQASKIAKGRV